MGETFDVAIIGYGPTGATLANLLVNCGLRVVVIEREAAMYHLPRAVHFDGETMRVFQAAGVADALAKRVRVNPGMRFMSPDGELLLDWPRPQEVGPQGWYASYRLHQPDLERLLRERLEGRATVLEESKVVGIEDRGDQVSLTIDGRDGVSSLEALYVVGCDGARSFTRGVIGAGVDDLGFEERWLVVDALLKRDRPDLGDHTLQFCDPDRPITYCRSPRNRRRWEITVKPGESEAEVTTPERLWTFLKPWITPEDADLERSAVYTFRSAVAERWRKGRVMIAGDAAHLTPPFMGQGMCAGIRDASNLAWKLALCVKGLTSESLLESYQAERAPHVRAFIETAVNLGGLINSLDRDAALALAEETASGSKRMETIAPSLGESDLGGMLSGFSAHQGALFGQPVLSDGTRLDEALGYAPVLIVRHELPVGVVAETAILRADEHPELGVALDALDVDAVLVRPDRYVAGTAKGARQVAKLASVVMPSPL